MKLPTPITPYPGAFLTFWDGSHSVCRVCVSLNKSTSYLSLCLSLNSFCGETSRTWASLNPETRCVISVGRLSVLAGFGSQPCGFKSQSGFWLGLSPGTWVQVPIWGARFQFHSILYWFFFFHFKMLYCFCFLAFPFEFFSISFCLLTVVICSCKLSTFLH